MESPGRMRYEELPGNSPLPPTIMPLEPNASGLLGFVPE